MSDTKHECEICGGVFLTPRKYKAHHASDHAGLPQRFRIRPAHSAVVRMGGSTLRRPFQYGSFK